jgi:predicted Zn-dependent protease
MRSRAWLALIIAALLAGAGPVRAVPASAVAEQLIAESGGVYADGRLAAYVRAVGQRLVGAVGRPGERWSFTVLDTPDANAFALPGGQIYVTRGMLALAGDEAELAAILGHEIGHALAGDAVSARTGRQRRAAEFAADRTAMGLMLKAGYDPAAEADFLQTLLASQRLEVRLAQEAGAELRMPRGSDHPALDARLLAAREDLGRVAAGRGARNRDAFLVAIDGMVWGDGAAQGFVRGRSFLHPGLRFAFDAPAGYAVSNQPDAVIAAGPQGALLLLDSLPDPGGSPEGYLAGGWVPEIARDVRAGPLESLRRFTLHGMAAAQALLPLGDRGDARIAELTVVRYRGRLYRLTGLYLPGDAAGAAALGAAAESFRPLSRAEAAEARPLRIRTHRIGRGDDVAAMAAAMPIPAARAQFEVLNGLRPGERLRVGDRIKLVAD